MFKFFSNYLLTDSLCGSRQKVIGCWEDTPITTDGRDQEPVSDRGNFLLADTDIDFVSVWLRSQHPSPEPEHGWAHPRNLRERGDCGHKIVISDIMLIDGLIADKDKRLSIQHLPLSENSEGQRVMHCHYHPHLRDSWCCNVAANDAPLTR